MASGDDEGVYDCVNTGSFGTLGSDTAEQIVRGTGNACQADLNGDGEVDFFDVSVFLWCIARAAPDLISDQAIEIRS